MDWLIWVQVALCVCSASFLLTIATVIWWKPAQLQRFFKSQGITGPPYRILYGNTPDLGRMMAHAKSTNMPLSHDIVARVLPHYDKWTKTYGEDIVYWHGPKARLNVRNLELIKEILSNKLGHYESPPLDPFFNMVTRQGLVGLNGEKWAHHRRIIAPAFHLNLLKGMVPTFVNCTTTMLEQWSKLVFSGEKEVDVLPEFRKLTADVISRTAFGSNYEEGKHIFNLQSQQMVLTDELRYTFYIPGFRFVPTRKNRRLWKLDKEIRRAVMQVIEGREKISVIEKSGSYGNDLLGLMMSTKKQQAGSNLQDVSMTKEEILGECKTIYFAGHETISSLLTWAIILLGMNQDWQERGRKEVLQVFGKEVYTDADSLNHLKIVMAASEKPYISQ